MAEPFRLSAFGGVYSNERALAATLAEVAARDTNETWCLGDLGGFGPHPDRAIEILRGAGVPSLRGNYDEAIGPGRHVVNAGVIGRPANDGRPGGSYAEITLGPEVQVELRRVGYDHEAQARAMENENLPAEFVETIRTGWWTTCLENLPVQERRRGRH